MHGHNGAHLIHAIVGVGFIGAEEAVGVSPQSLGVHVTEFAHANHRLFYAVLIHLRQRVGDIVLLLARLRYVLEHILSGHLEHFMAFFIHEHGLDPLIEVTGVVTWNSEHQIDNPDTCWHWHSVLTSRQQTNKIH